MTVLDLLKNLWNRDKPKEVSNDDIKALFDHLGIETENPALYKLAITHGSYTDDSNDNERLEFVGDAVLGLIVAEELFHKFPEKDEGQLSKLRSKVVNRKSLNNLGDKLEIHRFLLHKISDKSFESTNNYIGNAFEALVGAIYLDKGYAFTRNYLKERILGPYMDYNELEETIIDYKSYVIIWAQRHRRNFGFKLHSIDSEGHEVYFTMGFYLDGNLVTEGCAKNKKKAEQEASKKALEKLEIL